MTNTAIAKTDASMTVNEIKLWKGELQKLMKEALEEGIDKDYARIPGCGLRPVLLQPGAHKLLRLKGLISRMEIVDKTVNSDFVQYIVKCQILKPVIMPDGSCRDVMVCEKFGAANSEEPKFKLESQRHGKASQIPNLLMRAQKRAMVAATREATCSSDIFSQSEEDVVTKEDREEDFQERKKLSDILKERAKTLSQDEVLKVKITVFGDVRAKQIGKLSDCSTDELKALIAHLDATPKRAVADDASQAQPALPSTPANPDDLEALQAEIKRVGFRAYAKAKDKVAPGKKQEELTTDELEQILSLTMDMPGA
jgi:hypothetical protein